VPRPERGTTPSGFRDRLLALLRNAARQEGIAAQRLQQRVAFERLLARLSHEHWLLKGGFALELRYSWTHRPTKDIDLRTDVPLDTALSRLRAEMECVDGDRLTSSLRATFAARGTHEPPDALPQPPARWTNAFAALLAESPRTPIASLQEGYELAAQFWNPVLADEVVGMRWEPDIRQWRTQGAP
jgi:hypothetical protein